MNFRYKFELEYEDMEVDKAHCNVDHISKAMFFTPHKVH